jgi:hypothetical protein
MNRFYEWLTGKYTKPAGKLAMVVVYALASTAFVLAVVALFSRSRTFGNLAAAFAIVGGFVMTVGSVAYFRAARKLREEDAGRREWTNCPIVYGEEVDDQDR